MESIRIGSGAGYSGDRLEPALELLERVPLDYMAFECLAERTIALAQTEKRHDPSKGYNPLLDYRMERVLPVAHRKGVKILTNMGAANPEGALRRVTEIARGQRLKGLKIAAVVGDDVRYLLDAHPELKLLETGASVASLGDRIISANAYLGAGPMLTALNEGAQVVLTGRVADPSLFLAPMMHAFGWDAEDFQKMGRGTLIGHLLECAAQVSGGYFAEPGLKEVPELHRVGFPYVEVDAEGQGVISKAPGTGGLVSVATCTEQLLYEIHDPAAYLTPDCTADFSGVQFNQLGPDQVAFSGAGGRPATDTYKVSVGYKNGFLGVGEMSYGGPGCEARARLAAEIVRKRLASLELKVADLRAELIGVNAISPLETPDRPESLEVRLRVAGRVQTREAAMQIGREVETLYTNGPAAGGGATRAVREVISVASVLLPKTDVRPKLLFEEI